MHCTRESRGTCGCKPRYRAEVYDPSIKRAKKSPWMAVLADARGWRARTQNAIQNSPQGSQSSLTVEEAGTQSLEAVVAGTIRNRSRVVYKPSVARSYETSLRLHIYPLIGGKKIAALRRVEVQEVVDQLCLTRSPSTVKNALNPMRAMYRWLVSRGIVEADPTDGLELPQGTNSRDRIATPDEAAQLIDALAAAYQPIWGTAFYGGLRLGELRALKVADVDLRSGLITVSAGWDVKEGLITTKSPKGVRKVPIPATLKPYLQHHFEQRAVDSPFMFGIDPSTPFKSEGVRRKSYAAWEKAGLERIGFHEARHTYASILIAAGLDAKKVQVYMGHSSISTTYNIYGHLFPGNEAESARAIDAFLALS
jgi:integrase